jgi:hypothetical protein
VNSSFRLPKRARRARGFSKVLPILVTGLGFVAFAMVVPSNSSSKTEARIFTQGLAIQIDRSSPAYAALEDTLAADTQSDAEIAQAAETRMIAMTPAKPLLSGIFVREPIALKIIRDVRREESLLTQEREQRLENSRALIAALSSALPTVQSTSRPSTLAGTSVSTSDIAQVEASGGTVISNGQILNTQNIASVAIPNPQTKTISRTDLAKFFAPMIAPSVPGFQGLPPSPVSRHPSSAGTGTRVASFDNVNRATQVVQKDTPAPDNQNTGVHQVVISGHVEFTGGIAITNSNDRIVVYRELDEEKLEPAQVWPHDAKYEIFVDQPTGRLVGELHSMTGEIIGRGYFDLARLPKLETNAYRVDKISLMIGPIPQGISGSIVTAPLASDANPKARTAPVGSAHIQLGQLPFDTSSKKDGTFREVNLTEGSTVIAHADRPGHWGSIAFASAGTAVVIPMFSDATVRAIMTAATGSNHENERNTSLIWGRITRGGLPVANAHVDLMTSEISPVYFNKMMLPDSTLKATTENGLYAFFPIEPGSHAVQASDGHGVTEPSLFPTDLQTVTQVNLELNVTKAAKLRVYDAFKTDWPLAAEVISAGRKRGAMVPKSGEMKVTFTGGDGLLVLDADSGANYDRVRVMATKSEHKIDIPMVQTAWIDRIKGAMRVNADPHTGSIVGFIRGAPAYQVSLENESLGPNTKVLYFDARGELTAKNYGTAGGGFLMLNVPQGFRTVLVQPSSTSKALATAVLVEDSVTNVITKTF